MSRHHIRAENGSVDLELTPYFDNYEETRTPIASQECHQVHCKLNGYVLDSSGQKVKIDDVRGFFELAKNKW
jgi:hypothetical protein